MGNVEATTLLVVKLEAQQWNVVMAAMGELPYKHSAPVVAALMEQLQPQTTPMGQQPQSMGNGAGAYPAGPPA